jgi:hypothetical protein
MKNVKLIAAGLSAFVVLIAAICLYAGVVGYNDNQNYQIIQSPFGGLSVQDKGGYYFKGFSTVTTYPRSMSAEYTESKKPGSPGDESIRATFNDGGTAQVSSYVRIIMPTQYDQRINTHQQFGGNPANIIGAVYAHLANCIKSAGPVMSASENQASRKAEFNQIIEEQLAAGLFKMRRTEIELNDLSTIEEVKDENGNKVQKEKKAKVQATEIVLGKDGKPVVIQDSPLKQYGISIGQFSITEINYDHTTLEQFAAKKKSYLAAEQAKAERQQEVQQRLMIEEKGRRQVAEVEAAENQKKAAALIQANQAAEVAIVTKAQAVTAAEQRTEVANQLKKEAETLKSIASIKAETAELDKKATISAAEAKQKSIELGGGISEEKRVLAEIKAERDAKVAVALAGLKVPGIVIAGGAEGKGGNGLTENLINMTLLKSLGILKDEPAETPSK